MPAFAERAWKKKRGEKPLQKDSRPSCLWEVRSSNFRPNAAYSASWLKSQLLPLVQIPLRKVQRVVRAITIADAGSTGRLIAQLVDFFLKLCNLLP